jgi:hypothetical protein
VAVRSSWLAPAAALSASREAVCPQKWHIDIPDYTPLDIYAVCGTWGLALGLALGLRHGGHQTACGYGRWLSGWVLSIGYRRPSVMFYYRLRARGITGPNMGRQYGIWPYNKNKVLASSQGYLSIVDDGAIKNIKQYNVIQCNIACALGAACVCAPGAAGAAVWVLSVWGFIYYIQPDILLRLPCTAYAGGTAFFTYCSLPAECLELRTSRCRAKTHLGLCVLVVCRHHTYSHTRALACFICQLNPNQKHLNPIPKLIVSNPRPLVVVVGVPHFVLE